MKKLKVPQSQSNINKANPVKRLSYVYDNRQDVLIIEGVSYHADIFRSTLASKTISKDSLGVFRIESEVLADADAEYGIRFFNADYGTFSQC